MDSINSKKCYECDVSTDTNDEQVLLNIYLKKYMRIQKTIDFVVHALAYSDKEELKGKYVRL
jgi:enoyl-[acyl-carrier-protein] reductase (NADH)